MLVNCEFSEKEFNPHLGRLLLWELIRKFSSGAGIYSQIAPTSKDESTIRKKNVDFPKISKILQTQKYTGSVFHLRENALLHQKIFNLIVGH